MNYPKEQVAEALVRLRASIKPGDTIGTLVTHVSRSGMSRNIKLYHGNMASISWDVSRVLGDPLTDNHAVKVGGCGMDMGFHLVYNLGWALFKDSYHCTGKDCQSNDHNNEKRRNYRVGRKHSDPGYALKQRWI